MEAKTSYRKIYLTKNKQTIKTTTTKPSNQRKEWLPTFNGNTFNFFLEYNIGSCVEKS